MCPVRARTKASSRPASRWAVLAGLWLLYASFGSIAASLAPVVAPVEASLGMSHAAMGSILGAWQLVYIFSAVPCGMLLDRIGGQRALLIGVLLIAVSALGRALAVDYWSLLAAVMVFGLGGPIISSGAPKMVAELFTGSQRGMAMGIYMTGPAVGGVVCLGLTNGWLLPLLGSWRSVMLLWGAIALATGVIWFATGRLFPTSAAAAPAAWQPSAGELGRPSSSQLGAMAGLVRIPAVRLILVMSVGVFLFNHGLNSWLVEILRVGGMDAARAGYWATLPTLVGIVASLLIPRFAIRKRRLFMLMGLAAIALAAALLLRFTEPGPLTLGLILQGIAKACLMTLLMLTLVDLPEVGERRAGLASGMFFSAAEIGGVLGPLGIGVLYDASGGFDTSLWSLAGVAFLMIAGSLALHRTMRS